MNEKQELHCHECNRYVQFDLDLSLNGNHVLNCPNCGHEHCRVVKDGVITSDRWASKNGSNTYTTSIPVSGATSTAVSTYINYTTATGATGATTDTNIYLYDAWMNTTS